MKRNMFLLHGLLFLFITSMLMGQNADASNEAARHKNQGDALADKGDFRGAIESYTNAIKLNPLDDLCYLYRGLAHASTGDDANAIADYTNAIKLNSRRPSSYLVRGDAYGRRGETNKAIADYNQSITFNPNFPATYFKRAKQFVVKQDFNAAIADYTKAIELNPNETSYYNDRGIIFFNNKGDADKAIADYTLAIRCDPKNSDAYANRSLAYFMKGNFDKALEDCNQRIALSLPSADDYGFRGTIYTSKGEYDKALSDFARALQIDPNQVASYNNRGLLYINTGQFDAAISDFNKALKINPNFAVAYSGLGQAYTKKGEYDMGITYFTQSLRLEPSYKTYSNRGVAYFDKKEYQKAIDDYTQSIKLMPSAISYNNRGNAYHNLKQYDNAIADYTAALKLDPAYTDAIINRGTSYRAKGDNRRAITDLTEIIRLNPNGANAATAYGNRANAYADIHEWNNAIADYTQAMRLEPDSALYYANRGVAYRALNQPDKALADYEKCLELANKSSNINDIFQEAWRRAGFVYEQFPYLNDKIQSDSFFKKYADIARRGVSMGISRAENLRTVLGARGSDIMVRQLYLYYAGVDFEAKFGSPDAAFLYSESLRSRSFLEQIGSEAAMRLPGVTAGERTQIQNLTATISQLREQLNDLGASRIQGADGEKYAEMGLKLSEQEKQLTKLDAAIGSRIPQYAVLRNPQPVSMDQAKKWCGDDRVVLEYVLWDSTIAYNIDNSKPAINSYCLVISKKGVKAIPLDHNFNYSDSINQLRNKIISDPSLSRGLAVESNTISVQVQQIEQVRNDLYNRLIKPIVTSIPENVKNIVIVPDGSLMFLPFDILRENKDSQDLGEKYNLSMSPSVSVSVLAAKKDTQKNEPLLAFGGALYDRNKSSAEKRERGLVVLNDKSPDNQAVNVLFSDAKNYYRNKIRWLDLPGTVNEVTTLKGLAKNKPEIITGRDVSEYKVKQLSTNGVLKTYPIIHFACHGYFNETNPNLSSIVLSEVSELITNSTEDGYLTVPEIALLNMDARIVLLSACETGRGVNMRGDGMVGLPRAFMVAGAEKVGVSLWSISDEGTVEFMSRLYRKILQEKKSYRDAYSETKNEMRKDPKWSHPFYWAAFILYE
ncbi:hypothetical protein FACS189494_09710 [Spirochaetia bacterium]|nr:hypothetical protein FACS189494_09710 [Spirochaetia bacterium]